MTFADRLDAMIWIRRNQVSRRNLTDDQRAMNAAELAELVGQQAMRDRARKAVDTREVKAGRKPILLETSSNKIKTEPTANRKDIAKSAKVSEWKVRKAIEVKKSSPALAAKITSGEVTLADAVREIKKDKYEERVKEAAEKPRPIVQAGPFDLILSDPPWQYDFAKTSNQNIENHYKTATVDEIKTHSPNSAKDCVLLLWATAPKLLEALDVMKAWGFEYKTHAIWDKQKIGMGYWFRGQHELLLVGTKGKSSPPAETARVSSIFSEPRGKHSVKPRCVYEWIEKSFPGLSKLEMYCRSPRDGWASWGNEV